MGRQSPEPDTRTKDTATTSQPHHASRPLALTMGDPAGIGLDITCLAWQARHEQEIPPFALIADPSALSDRASALGITVPIREITRIDDASTAFENALPVLPLPLAERVTPGKPSVTNARTVITSIEMAITAAQDDAAAAIVTNPIAKHVLQSANFAYPGHTEYLASRARAKTDHEAGSDAPQLKPVMMLAADELRVVPATIHIPLKDVIAALTPDLLIETAKIVAQALKTDFGIANPRIALTGLNPHAGENGTLGTEDDNIIRPAIKSLRALGLEVTGPYPADTLFHAEARATYDVAIATYHDQALIPIKTLAFDRGVNVTLGLPFVRTSPDHGTAFDLAGTGRASPTSLIEALKLADQMSKRRNTPHTHAVENQAQRTDDVAAQTIAAQQ